LRALLTRFLRDQSGATAVEYGLLLASIFLAIIGAVTLFGQEATGKLIEASDAIVGAS
jgi:pilus assembly protein Flp/PilA